MKITVRNIDYDLYVKLWNLRRKLKARSWTDMLRKICEEMLNGGI